MTKRRVLITGATGYVAGQILPLFREHFDLTLVDSRSVDGSGQPMDGVEVVDLLDSDRASYSPLFQGVDAVVHLALVRTVPGGSVAGGVPSPPVLAESPREIDEFASERPNIRMAYNVFRAAFEAGVDRVVFASSNRVGDWTEHALVHDRKLDMITEDMLPRADTFYGWSKAVCERMAFMFACGAFGRRMGVVNVRIGWPHELDAAAFGDDVNNYKRALAAHLSATDAARLFLSAVQAPDIDDEHGVPWRVVFGTSDNTRSFWSLAEARRLGYDPVDDSEVKYASGVESLILDDKRGRAPGRVTPAPQDNRDAETRR